MDMENNKNKNNCLLVPCSNKNNNKGKKMKMNLSHCSNKKRKSTVSTLSICLSDSASHTHSSNDLYICLSIPEDKSINNVIWYKINPNYSVNHQGITSVCSIPPEKVGHGFGVTSLGSNLYMVGGAANGSKDMYCIDTRVDDEHRKLETHTLADRQGSAVVSAQGKIYVFGCNWTKPKPWAEVFDPTTNHCSPLPEPPNQLLQGSRPIYASLVGDKIILSYQQILASFDVNTNSWQLLLSSRLRDAPCRLSSTTVDDVLFMYSDCSVVAYDVLADKWFKHPVRGLKLESMSFLDSSALYYGQVVHLGDRNMCVIWLDEFEGGQFEHCIRCVKFRVSRIYDTEKQEEVLQADVHARSSYRLLSGGSHFVDCFPM